MKQGRGYLLVFLKRDLDYYNRIKLNQQKQVISEVQEYNAPSLTGIMGGTLIQNGSNETVKHLMFDSRGAITNLNTLFFALKGDRFNGHDFIKDLYDRGVKNFVIDQNFDVERFNEASFIRVDDSTEALQRLAVHHRNNFDIPVIGVTGSNGKTIVKEWLFQLLNDKYSIVRSPKSYNSQLGVPLSIWSMDTRHELAIFEAGISEPGEMDNLQKIIQPTIGIFTNIGHAHDAFFKNQQHKIREKLLLFKDISLLIYRNEKGELADEIQLFLNEHQIEAFTWSMSSEADLKINSVTTEAVHTLIKADFKKEHLEFKIPFNDEASIENALHCIALMLSMEIDSKVISEKIGNIVRVAMRLELKEAINNCALINDSYNSDMGSLRIAIDYLDSQKQFGKKTLILSDILQSGKEDDVLYKEVGALVQAGGIKKFIGIGKGISSQQDSFSAKKLETYFFDDTEQFIDRFHTVEFRDETILLKGARTFEFEKIGRLLEKKVHSTVLEINLNAILQNLNTYRSMLKPETKILAMVKAFSYGSGSYEISNFLQYNRVDYLAVAYADEGFELRRKGITTPLLVMSPEVTSFINMLEYGLEPVISDMRMLESFIAISDKATHKQKDKANIHLKLETGMNRLGFEEGDLDELTERLKHAESVHVASIFSHLAASNREDKDEFTSHQFDLFTESAKLISSALGYPVLKHILNSSGVVRFPEMQLDMVRIGIGLYGIDPTGIIQDQLVQSSRLRTTVTQIRHVKAGETIGYDCLGQVTIDSTIAVIGIGYADGFRRNLGNGKGKVLIGGHLFPTIGNICMDMCMIDITGSTAEAGDEVIIFSEELPLYEFAAYIDTVPYEVLTGISQRVKRIYYYE